MICVSGHRAGGGQGTGDRGRGTGDWGQAEAESSKPHELCQGSWMFSEDILKVKNKTQGQVQLNIWFRSMSLAVKGQRDNRGGDQ